MRVARVLGLAMCLAGCESILGLRELRFEDNEAGSDAATSDVRESDCALEPDADDAGHEVDPWYEAREGGSEGESPSSP